MSRTLADISRGRNRIGTPVPNRPAAPVGTRAGVAGRNRGQAVGTERITGA